MPVTHPNIKRSGKQPNRAVAALGPAADTHSAGTVRPGKAGPAVADIDPAVDRAVAAMADIDPAVDTAAAVAAGIVAAGDTAVAADTAAAVGYCCCGGADCAIREAGNSAHPTTKLVLKIPQDLKPTRISTPILPGRYRQPAH